MRQYKLACSKPPVRGFTLIEMLVVFTLLALLLSIAVPRYLQVADSSRSKVREQNLATLRDALDKFKADQGRFPNELDELVAKKYLRMIPVDPLTGSHQWKVVKENASDTAGVADVEPPVLEPSFSTSDVGASSEARIRE